VSSLTGEVTECIGWLERHLPEYRERHHLNGGVVTATFALTQGLAVRDALLRLRRRLAHVRDADDDRAIHRARLAGKRLRYVLEPTEPWTPGARELIRGLKALQDASGDLHDVHVWRGVLHQELERLGADEAQRVLDQARAGTTSRANPNRRVLAAFRGVAEALEARRDERYATLLAAWSGAPLEAFDAQVHALADMLEQASTAGVEIERKFLLSALPPDRPEGELRVIEQGYLPGTRLIERLRHVTSAGAEAWYRTVKSGSGVARLELEEETTAEVFSTMWPLTRGKRVTKRRHVIADGGQVWELDEFTDRELVLAEVELPSAAASVAFPSWLAPFVVREVTDDPTFVNAALAR
jgi:CYTH domain-containing protein